MRIVSGRFKGRALAAPDGRDTRPTSDRAREAVFNVLAHADWAPALEGAAVIDLFAGSGALGFEALSRGASVCLFVETDARARAAIRTNSESFGLNGVTRLHRRSATDLGPRPAGAAPKTLAFLDPPYAAGLADGAIRSLVDGDWLADGAGVVVETAADTDLAAGGLTLQADRTYGRARVRFYTKAG